MQAGVRSPASLPLRIVARTRASFAFHPAGFCRRGGVGLSLAITERQEIFNLGGNARKTMEARMRRALRQRARSRTSGDY